MVCITASGKSCVLARVLILNRKEGLCMAKEKFVVAGMSCGHCVATIKKAVGGLAGVVNVDVSLDNKEVSVEFDESKVTIGTVFTKIKDAGFEVK